MQIYLPIAELSLNVFYLAGIGGDGRLPVGIVRCWRGVPADAAPDLFGHSLAGGGRLGHRSGRRRLDLGGAVLLAARRHRPASGALSGALRHPWRLRGRRHLQRPARRRPARSRHLPLLRRLSRLGRRPHAAGSRARPRQAAARPGRSRKAAAPPQLGARTAPASAVQTLQALCQRPAGSGHRRRARLSRRAARHRRRLHPRAGPRSTSSGCPVRWSSAPRWCR